MWLRRGRRRDHKTQKRRRFCWVLPGFWCGPNLSIGRSCSSDSDASPKIGRYRNRCRWLQWLRVLCSMCSIAANLGASKSLSNFVARNLRQNAQESNEYYFPYGVSLILRLFLDFPSDFGIGNLCRKIFFFNFLSLLFFTSDYVIRFTSGDSWRDVKEKRRRKSVQHSGEVSCKVYKRSNIIPFRTD